MNALWVVLKKELLDLFRDRRTLMISLLMGPLLGPALMIGIITLIAKKETERAEKPLELPVIGVEHAPNLVDWLGMHNIVVEAAPSDPDAAILNQDEDVILRISEDFGEDWRGSKPASLEAIIDVLLKVGGDNGLLMQHAADISEADINPLIVSETSAVAVDARFILG